MRIQCTKCHRFFKGKKGTLICDACKYEELAQQKQIQEQNKAQKISPEAQKKIGLKKKCHYQ